MSKYDFRLLNVSFFLFLLTGDFVITSNALSRKKKSTVENNHGQTGYSGNWSLVPWIPEDFRIQFGQISGVAIDPDENIYLFHRADHVWDNESFTNQHIYTRQALGPIKTSAILVFRSDGSFLDEFGKNLFYLPHGITIDRDFNIWVTDVALHQVMKISPKTLRPVLTLGEKFRPGSGSKHFCKPTSVAVLSNGDFFVADGYCNARIIKFNADGEKILEWGRPTTIKPGMYDLLVPHALTLAEDRGAVCVADRENGRVMCYKIDTGEYLHQFSSSLIGPQVFSVAYSSTSGGRFFLVNGENMNANIGTQGFILNPKGDIVGEFGKNLQQPHDIAVSANGSTVYVVEIGPNKAWKYINNNHNCDNAASKDVVHSSSVSSVNYRDVSNVEGLTGAVLVTISCFVFAAGLLMAVLIYSKSRRSPSSDTRRLLSNVE